MIRFLLIACLVLPNAAVADDAPATRAATRPATKPTTRPADAAPAAPVARFETVDDAVAFVEEWAKPLTPDNAAAQFALLARVTPTYDAAQARAIGASTQSFMQGYAKRYGAFLGLERLEVRAKGPSLALASFLVRFDNMAVVLHFLVYRGGDDAWQISTWTFDRNGPYGPFGVTDASDAGGDEDEDDDE